MFYVLLIFPRQLNTTLNRGSGGLNHNYAYNSENIFSNVVSHVSMSQIVAFFYFFRSSFLVNFAISLADERSGFSTGPLTFLLTKTNKGVCEKNDG